MINIDPFVFCHVIIFTNITVCAPIELGRVTLDIYYTTQATFHNNHSEKTTIRNST